MNNPASPSPEIVPYARLYENAQAEIALTRHQLAGVLQLFDKQKVALAEVLARNDKLLALVESRNQDVNADRKLIEDLRRELDDTREALTEARERLAGAAYE